MSEVPAGRLNQSSNWKRMNYLNQGQIWKGRGGVEVEIKSMSPLYCRRAAKVLQRQHEDLFRTVCAELLQMTAVVGEGDPMGKQREIHLGERTDMQGGSKVWIQRKELMQALHRRGAEVENDRTDDA